MNKELIEDLVDAIEDAEAVLDFDGATDKRRLDLTDIQRETMAEIIEQWISAKYLIRKK
jgi:hypothetical protein